MQFDDAILLLSLVAHPVNQSCLVLDSVELPGEPSIGFVVEILVHVFHIAGHFIRELSRHPFYFVSQVFELPFYIHLELF